MHSVQDNNVLTGTFSCSRFYVRDMRRIRLVVDKTEMWISDVWEYDVVKTDAVKVYWYWISTYESVMGVINMIRLFAGYAKGAQMVPVKGVLFKQ